FWACLCLAMLIGRVMSAWLWAPCICRTCLFLWQWLLSRSPSARACWALPQTNARKI
ncbi:hypothetical protein IW141_004978, partial [Coemansia sp. RSA 355]